MCATSQRGDTDMTASTVDRVATTVHPKARYLAPLAAVKVVDLTLCSGRYIPALVFVARHSKTAGLSNGGGESKRMPMADRIAPRIRRGIAKPNMAQIAFTLPGVLWTQVRQTKRPVF